MAAAKTNSVVNAIQSPIAEQTSQPVERLAMRVESASPGTPTLNGAVDQMKAMTSGSSITTEATNLKSMTQNVEPILTKLDEVLV